MFFFILPDLSFYYCDRIRIQGTFNYSLTIFAAECNFLFFEESDQRSANEAKLEGLLKTPVKFEIYDLGAFPSES